ncbi:hypothetical protein BRYFOR_07816 [Marvinbryantia formatexigens DSM 14469]|uniref:Uncharacterized protein n=1 Tax=Marvinbryantia formatexigens DSM 14469 TaxID=478749 RepID=C6LGQ6_9FIRM|nr:hypothetical protein BRYFOR_07816 [Marvinbryantia formatexigens DSM 14469]
MLKYCDIGSKYLTTCRGKDFLPRETGDFPLSLYVNSGRTKIQLWSFCPLRKILPDFAVRPAGLKIYPPPNET